MASMPGHETCASIVPTGPVADESRLNAKKLASLQWLIHRMQVDADGVPGSYNDAHIDSWYPYNAKGSYNFADSYSYEVLSVNGKEITCETTGDPLDILLFTWRERDSSGMKWINGFERHGAPQAGDVMQFSGNSVITYTCWPIITRIKNVSGSQITFELDKAPTAVLTKYEIDDGSGGTMPDPNPVTVKVWHHAGNPEAWRFIQPPEYFYGKRKTTTILAADLPTDGIVQISDVAVMHPGGFDPLEDTWLLEGQRIDTFEWESVSDRNARLYVLPTGPSRIAIKTFKPSEGTNSPASDLTVTYRAFRATFWEKTDGDDASCRIVGYARCKWSIQDPSGSNYGTGDGKAPGSVNAGVITPGRLCLKRAIDVHTISDSNSDGYDDTATHSSVSATGVSRYPSDGQCLQHGCCDHFEPAEGHEDGTPFSYAHHAGLVIRDLVGATNQRLLRLVPRVGGFWPWQAQRVQHPSILWHHGYVGIDLPNVIDDQVARFRGYGLWGLGYHTYSDSSGNEFLELVSGATDGAQFGAPDPVDNANYLEDTDGHLAMMGASYKTRRDPVTPGATISEREFERLGIAIERGSGQLQDRGIAQSSVAVAAQDIIIPAIDLSATGIQTRVQGSFEWDVDGNGVIKLLPLRQERKDPVLLGTRKVSSISSLGGGKVRLYLDNGDHTYSQINDGPSIGDSFDQKFTYAAGGAWPVMPKPLNSVNSHYEPDNYEGSRNHGAWRGDSIKVGDDYYIIDAVVPFGGSDAATWGDVRRDKYNYTVPPIWQPLESNLALGTDPETYGEMVITAVTDTSTSTALIPIDQIDRPTSIPVGQYWTDGSGIYVGAAVNLQVDYDVEKPKDGGTDGSYTEYVTVPSTLEMLTMIPSADYTGADNVAITVDGEAATPTADSSGTYVVITYDLLQAALPTEITLEFNEEADPPQDHYSYDRKYLDYAKKQDYIDAYDDPNGKLATVTPGTDVGLWSAAAVMMPGAGLEIIDYATDNWQAVTGTNVRHGLGIIVIPAAFFAGKTGTVCWKVTDAKLMDHRGIVPASVINKLEAWAEADKWVRCGMGAAKGGSYAFARSIGQSHTINKIDNNPVGCDETFSVPDGGLIVIEDDFSGHNYVSVGVINAAPSTVECGVHVEFHLLNSFGAPAPLSLLPDGTTILEAWMELSASGLEYQYTDADGVTTIVTTDVTYTVVGLPTRDSYETIGSVSGGQENIIVVNATGIFQTMFAQRSSGLYPYGYGVIVTPDIVTDMESMLPGPPAVIVTPNSSPCGYSSDFERVPGYSISWDGISIGEIIMDVRYHSGEIERITLIPRVPMMADI